MTSPPRTRSLSGASIEIRPEVTILSVLKHLNYKPWFAIAEFIDNSLQSFLANQEALRELHGADYCLNVTVEVETAGPGQITITDNAGGITQSDFPRAFRPAHIPTDRTGLSEFGMGMKSAACWFARQWSVRTKALGETVERTIHFDVDHIVDNKIESLQTDERQVQADKHYTVVTLKELHHIPQGRTITKIKEHLASIYRVFLADGRLTLKFNKEHLSYQRAAVLTALPYTSPSVPARGPDAKPVTWEKPISLDFGGGHKVTGFAALREVGSTPFAGFALFRRDRLIEGSYDETYRPSYIFKQTNSYPYQRLFGELHVEGFEVSHTKDGFRWEQYEDIFLEYLKIALEEGGLNLLAQADNYRALPNKRTINAQANLASASVAKYLTEEVAPLLLEAKSHPADPSEIPTSLESSDLQTSERTVEIDDGDFHWVITLRTSIDPAAEAWVVIAKDETPASTDAPKTRRLVLDLALAHPFSAEFIGARNENLELLLRMATAICVSLILSEDMSGEPPEGFLYHFNQLLRGAIMRANINESISTNPV